MRAGQIEAKNTLFFLYTLCESPIVGALLLISVGVGGKFGCGKEPRNNFDDDWRTAEKLKSLFISNIIQQFWLTGSAFIYVII